MRGRASPGVGRSRTVSHAAARMLERLTRLIDDANTLLSQRTRSEYSGGTIVPLEGFRKWKAQSLVAIATVVGEQDAYYREFVDAVRDQYASHVESGRGILAGLLDDVAAGYLVRVRQLIEADLLSDFLDMAEHLLANGYVVAAASIAGATLENGLRDILVEHGEELKQRGNLQSLAQMALQKQIVTSLEHKSVQVWVQLRDHADHGEFDKVQEHDVRQMLGGVRDFLSKHLA